MKSFPILTPRQVSKNKQTNEMNTVENIVEEIFNPSAKDMRVFKEMILANKDLAKLFSGADVSLVQKTSEKSQVERKPRATAQPKADGERCQAVVWNLEKDSETGELKPKRCTRGCEGSSNFCKQHGLIDGKRCSDCSNYFGEDVIHQFKHEHMGTIHEPSYIFEKYHNDVLKIYQKSQQVAEMNIEYVEKVQVKKTAGRKKKESVADGESKPKRALNPYMKFLQDNRENIKAELLLANPELKGRDLQTGISKRAGELWKLQAKGKVLDSPAVEKENEEELHANVGEADEEPTVEEEKSGDEEETMTLTYNDKLKVWIDEETGLYYEDEEGTDAKGSVVNGTLRPFKIVKKNL